MGWTGRAPAPNNAQSAWGLVRRRSTCGSRKFDPAGFARGGRISASSDAMLAIVHLLGTLVANLFKSRRRLEAENLFLRHQLNIALRRRPPRFRLRDSDRALLVWMTRLWPSLLGLARVIEPATILRWHRAGSASIGAGNREVEEEDQDPARATRSHPTNEQGKPIVGRAAHSW
jgi:hypothetical protein